MAKSTSKKTKKASAPGLKSASPNSFAASSDYDGQNEMELEDNSSTPSSEQPSQGDAGLEELFLDSIKDIYWAENHLVKVLPKLLKAAGTQRLQEAFSDHLEVTKGHVARLEQIFELLGEKKQAKKCDAMEGLSMEGEGIIEDTLEGTTSREVGLILAAQKTEHYEIATYKGLAKLATALGKNDVAAILSQTLTEEQEADALLASIAENDLDYNTDSIKNA